MSSHEPQRDDQSHQQSPLKQLAALHDLMRECQDCQTEVDPHWQFCAHCGTRLATQCPGCGNPLPPAGARTCPHCGLAIPQAQG